MEKRLPRKRDWEREHDILMSISDYPGVLSSLVAEYPENKQALDYLLCYYLLNENLNSFKNKYGVFIDEVFNIYDLINDGYLVLEDDYLKIDKKYMYISNEVIVRMFK